MKRLTLALTMLATACTLSLANPPTPYGDNGPTHPKKADGDDVAGTSRYQPHNPLIDLLYWIRQPYGYGYGFSDLWSDIGDIAFFFRHGTGK